jgi:hypothetical protein
MPGIKISFFHLISSNHCKIFFSYRFICWNVVLYTMLVFVIVIIPFYIGYFVLSNIRFGKYNTFLYSCDKLLYIYHFLPMLGY